MFTEDDLLPLSAVQHLVFCERQYALMYIERQWAENWRTVKGKDLHERTHEQGNESRGDLRIARGLALRSLRLGLSGIADVVEFHRVDENASSPGAPLPGAPGLWRPFPVEYKRGKPKPNRCDEVQLCAQALCLEEMLHVAVPGGALFYGATRRRMEVNLDADLRRRTEEAAARVHELLKAGITPKAVPARRCRSCSLVHLCLPKAARRRSPARYLSDMLRQEDP